MTCGAIGPPRDQCVRTEGLEFDVHLRSQAKETRRLLQVVAEMCVGKPEQNRCVDAESIRRTASLFAAYAREFGPSRNRRVRPALGTIGCDDQIDLYALAGITREDRRGGALVIAVCKHRDQ